MEMISNFFKGRMSGENCSCRKENKPCLMNSDNHLVRIISVTMLKYTFYGPPSVHQLSFVLLILF